MFFFSIFFRMLAEAKKLASEVTLAGERAYISFLESVSHLDDQLSQIPDTRRDSSGHSGGHAQG
jgi:hypothetical protein